LAGVRRSLAKLQFSQARLQRQGKASDAFAADLSDRIHVLEGISSQLQDVKDSPGQVMVGAHVVRTERARTPTKWAGSGAGIGLLLALALASFRPMSGWSRRAKGRRSIPRVWDVSPRRAG
jgi:hypothetical protein